MKIAFRADASLQIGTGHIMRCLTLARALEALGHQCAFLSREHDGNLNFYVRNEGFDVHEMPLGESPVSNVDADLAHASWLGVSQEQDARQSAAFLSGWEPDWVVVDHYGLDQRWESRVREHCTRLFVIDDLVDRPHQCEALLDQTLGRIAADYRGLTPSDCVVFAGPEFALLRPEFSSLRSLSLTRRASPRLDQILISMGGVDQQNATSTVLETLRISTLDRGCRLEVVLGATAPWLNHVRALAATMPFQTEVLVGVRDMANRMASCDLAIGAAGSTSWERCCLGVPTLMVVLAENQRPSAAALAQHGTSILLGDAPEVGVRLPQALASVADLRTLRRMSQAAASVCDGMGAQRIASFMGTIS